MNNFNYQFYEQEININLEKVINEDLFKKNSLVNMAMSYSLLSGGKRLRPMLFNVLLKHFNVDYQQYYPIACAIEMIHTYSLVHDDLPCMDDDDLRRNLPTTHIKYGEANALLCGDALLTDAFYLLTTTNLNPEVLMQIIKLISLASGSSGMIYGQELDMNLKITSVYELENVFYYKTARLIQASIVAAAIIAKQSLNDYLKLGEYLGIAFQIQDDLLEATKSSEQLGKSNQSDLKNDKVSVVKLIGIDQANLLLNQYLKNIEDILVKLNLKNSEFNDLVTLIMQRNK